MGSRLKTVNMPSVRVDQHAGRGVQRRALWAQLPTTPETELRWDLLTARDWI
jgi:hypothetical protein